MEKHEGTGFVYAAGFRWGRALTCAPLAVAVLTIACFLLVGRFAGSAGYWFDELWSIHAVRGSLPRMLDILTADVHPPLYHLLLWGWVRIFGFTEFATHILSALLAASAAPAVYMLGRRLELPARLAMPAALIAVAGHAATTYGNETRPYALGLTLSMWTCVFVARRFGWKAFAAAFVFGLAGVFAHYTVAIPLTVSAGALAWRFDRRWFFLPCAWAIACLPASVQIMQQAGKFVSLGWLGEPSAADVTLALRFLFGVPAGEYAALAIGWVALGAFLWRGRYRDEAWLFILPVTVALFFTVSHLWQPVFHHRYLLPLAGWAALTVIYLVSLIPHRPTQLSLAAVMTLGLVLVPQLGHGTKDEDWRAPAEYVTKAGDGYPVLVSQNDRFFRHYLPHAVVIPAQDTSTLEAWLEAREGTRFWYLQARDFTATPLSSTLAERTNIVEMHNFPQTRALLLRGLPAQESLTQVSP